MRNQLSKLIRASHKYALESETMEKVLSDKIEFKFQVVFQPNDGFCILNEESADLSRLVDCISIIEQKGVLSYEDFKRKCI